MARTTKVKAPKEVSKVKAPVEIKGALLHVWEKVVGKYHTKDRKLIVPGQTFIAGKDTFAKDATWRYIGPVE